ncbi:MAG: 2-amino-4-hydroxy-6-hydroxymethyldihydropteridine diphosphokinase [Proteobacteria bacterium]|nr:2-amino-4-hydroxy-6-hydroxymethyldihydropteridine diphosphokinase [Pseudomonadota bacterium]MCK4866513.1 2-amino-4-hydroxy-6-hydroxymethyldihydropteridine diphosphokinase [Alphaproteobacteria bacterium]
MTLVYVALGGNIGDRMANLKAAIAALAPEVTVLERSPVYETDPKYVTDQPRFLNMVLSAETDLGAPALLVVLKSIEKKLGRGPGERNGPRPIDLDIVFFGDEVIDLPDLTVPHPRLAERAFVLRPLADIASARMHPVTGLGVGEMLDALEDDGGLISFQT